nr:hypothetical protein [Interfilum sp. SAG 36.88]
MNENLLNPSFFLSNPGQRENDSFLIESKLAPADIQHFLHCSTDSDQCNERWFIRGLAGCVFSTTAFFAPSLSKKAYAVPFPSASVSVITKNASASSASRGALVLYEHPNPFQQQGYIIRSLASEKLVPARAFGSHPALSQKRSNSPISGARHIQSLRPQRVHDAKRFVPHNVASQDDHLSSYWEGDCNPYPPDTADNYTYNNLMGPEQSFNPDQEVCSGSESTSKVTDGNQLEILSAVKKIPKGLKQVGNHLVKGIKLEVDVGLKGISIKGSTTSSMENQLCIAQCKELESSASRNKSEEAKNKSEEAKNKAEEIQILVNTQIAKNKEKRDQELHEVLMKKTLAELERLEKGLNN